MANDLNQHPVMAEGILHGLHLLEADAGSGKTWTVTRLVLRAILERQLSIGQIAVLTYTNAAAAELKARIGSLLDACLARDTHDAFLAEYSSSLDDAELDARLRLARLQLDDAPIGTIHNFCHRILSDHSLSLGHFAALEPGPEDGELLARVLADWWREHISHSPLSNQLLLGRYGLSLTGIQAVLSRVLAQSEPGFASDTTPDWTTLPDRLNALVDQLRSVFDLESDLIAPWLADKGNANGRLLQARFVHAWLAQIDHWINDFPNSLDESCKGLANLDLASIGERYHCERSPLRLFDLIEQLNQLRRERLQLNMTIAAQYHDSIALELQQLKRESSQISFDDLLLQTHRALLDPQGGAMLASRLRVQYPLAFVDEFQDTDPVQWQIFRSIYLPDGHDSAYAPESAAGLILVGDPKQAIYAFRNADIHTYLSARNQGASIHRLSHNRRSGRPMIESLNALWDREQAFGFDAITFDGAQFGDQADDPSNLPPPDGRGALCFIRLNEGDEPDVAVSTDTLNRRAVQASCHEIARLLERPDDDLTPADIAVLVPTARHGSMIKAGLATLGIGAVEMSRASVFESQEADDLQRLLAALANPSDAGLLRGALMTSLIGMDVAELEQMQASPAGFEHIVDELYRARQQWPRAGSQALLRRLIFRVFARAKSLAAHPLGERRLTNILHLLELLGEAPQVAHGAAQAVLWLGRQIRHAADGDAGAQGAQLRLESDDRVVRILTVHASKGLEFPVVFLPFAWVARRKAGRQIFSFHDESSGRRLIASSPPSGLPELKTRVNQAAADSAERDDSLERLRLSYVALTRARRRCYVGWGLTSTGPAKSKTKSKKPSARKAPDAALSYLLAANQPADTSPEWDSVCERLDELVASAEHTRQFDWSALTQVCPNDTQLANRREPAALSVRESLRLPVPAWSMRSFTSMVSRHSAVPDAQRSEPPLRPDHDLVAANTDTDDEAATGSAHVDETDNIRNTLSRGANTGTCLHLILEKADFTSELARPAVEEALRSFALDADADQVRMWLNEVLDVDLNAGSTYRPMPLRQITAPNSLREMGFTLAVEQTDMSQIAAAVASEFPLSPALGQNADWQGQGFLNGFIDLVVRDDDKYWLVDWKSNWLAASPRFYGQAQMGEAIAEHGYAIQFCLYTIALHRLLSVRLHDYQYDRHIGGVRYLFIRGMVADEQASPNAQASGVYHARPSAQLIDTLDRLLGGSGCE